MKLRNFRKGFTLIELLVVMVIIAILATLGIVAYSNSLQNARNSKRISDLNSMQASFEQYFTANGTYAAYTTMAASLQGSILPSHPTQGSAYSYTPSGATDPTTSYCICALLEGGQVRGGNSDSASCGDYNTATAGSGPYYCVRNRQ